jgi:hypothetical protein
MKRQIAVAILLLAVACAKVNAGEGLIVPGSDIGAVSTSMAASGYKETGLDMLAMQKDAVLKFWSVGQGVLIAVYSTANKKVLSLSYSLSDERPKATRRTFDLVVKEFDPKSGEMKIAVPNKAPEDTARKLADPQR